MLFKFNLGNLTSFLKPYKPHGNTTPTELEQLKGLLLQERQNTDLKIKQQTAVLTSQINLLQSAISGINEGLIVINQTGQIAIFNKTAQYLTGYSETQVLGKSIDQIIKVYDQTQELILIHYCPFRASNFEGIIYQKRGLRIVGLKESFVDLTTSQIETGSPIMVNCILILRDSTREKQLESMKLDFVSMAAHELRTPLTSIKGYLSVFVAENKTKVDTSAQKLLDALTAATEQLTALVENLLSVTRIDRGVVNINLEAIDWSKFIKDLVSDFQPRAQAKQITLEYLPSAQSLPEIKADQVRINEVLSNLISNAINYTDPGGTITVWAQLTQDGLITSVKDSGHGIPKEAIPQLFNKFFRVGGSLEQGIKGTGLGLYISKSIMDLHHGKIWVDSELGKGSTFSFSLPVG